MKSYDGSSSKTNFYRLLMDSSFSFSSVQICTASANIVVSLCILSNAKAMGDSRAYKSSADLLRTRFATLFLMVSVILSLFSSQIFMRVDQCIIYSV